MGVPNPSRTGPQVFGTPSVFGSMPDGSIINFAHTRKAQQSNNNLLITYADGTQDTVAYSTTANAAAALAQIATFLVAQYGLLTLTSITPATATNGSTVNAVLLGTAFNLDFPAGSFLGTIKIGAGTTASVVFVNSNTVLLQFTAPAPGTYDVTYQPGTGAVVTLTGAWVST